MVMNAPPSQLPPPVIGLLVSRSLNLTSSNTTLSLTDTLEHFSLPYGIIGTTLKLFMYYALASIAVHARSPTTLRPLQYRLYTAILCFFSGVASASTALFGFINKGNAAHAAGHSNWIVGYYAVNACLPLFTGVIAMIVTLARRRDIAQSPANEEKEKEFICGVSLAYLLAFALGIWGLYEVVRDGWGIKGMQMFVGAAFGGFCVVAIFVGVMAIQGLPFERNMPEPPVSEAWKSWVFMMVAVGLAGLPIVMDVALAILAGNAWGVQMGKTTEVVALYSAYVTACVLPALAV
ncbi:hypothetical protein CC86DRAFT_380659 [Ophiobolus disseminans]|uniref:Uncharacterized protein n=1 Tax=Ophiobolus disseminans TaxID=1469910 RepID=A0A6A7A668_9PLEO|nr:hypothetical protein CC86DRAFT_380659 [Ophiobolus disseminans]